MTENRTLLSQDEIDALVSFLQDNSQTSSIGDVLDQSRIDKLIEIIQFNNNHGVYISSDTASIIATIQADIPDAKGNPVDTKNCILEFKTDASGNAELTCKDTLNSVNYRISPNCLVSKQYVEDNALWGRTILPGHFIKVANMFRIDYTDATYNAVKARFAEVMYGDANAEIAAVYFSNAD